MSDSATPMPPASRLDDKTIYGRELRIPLVLAVSFTVALALTVRYFQPGLEADGQGWLTRLYQNVFYQIITLVFVAAISYAGLQFLGVHVDRRTLAAPGKAPRGALHTLLAFVSGRPSRAEGGLGGVILRWRRLIEEMAGHPERRRALEGLGEHILVLRDHQRRQNLIPIQFTIWVLPLLGFIGTVVGITQSIVGLEGVVAAGGEQASAGLQDVLHGLQFAFDTTFLGLVLVIPTMALSLLLRELIQRLDLEYQQLLLDGFLTDLIATAVLRETP